MISDQRLAEFCSRAYTMTPTWQAADAYVCRFDEDGYVVLAWRGTSPTALADWFRDLDTIPRIDSVLGCCHAGFLGDMLAVYPLIANTLANNTLPVIVTGHSKGAAEALLFSARMIAFGKSPAATVTFGSPRLCLLNETLPRLLAGQDGRDFRHGADPVPDVPFGFEHPRILTQLGYASSEPLADHSIVAYRAALLMGNKT